MPKRKGRKSAAQTPSLLKERIYGSKKNAKGSASSEKSAKKIVLSDKIIKALKNKLTEFKKVSKKNITLDDLKAVYRRGAGAYSSSHRPNIPRNAWAMARVNKFLKKAKGEKVKAAYVQDDDLLKDGGEIGEVAETMEQGGEVRKPNELLFNELLSFYTRPDVEDFSIFFEIPNELYDQFPFIGKGDLIISVFEKKNHSANAKPIITEILQLANKYQVILWISVVPSHKYILNKEHRNKISRDYIINYAKKFGFKQLFNLNSEKFMVRYPNNDWTGYRNFNFSNKTKKIGGSVDVETTAKALEESDGTNPEIRYEDGGLIAPNGRKSNLTPEQYKLVRTPEFKAWFGDWENDPESASKVVDENGEPLVVYHGTKKVFTSFYEKKYLGSLHDSLNFFTTSYKTSVDDYDGWITYPCFLKIVHPLIDLIGTPESSITSEKEKGLKTDGFIFSYGVLEKKPKTDRETWLAVPKSNQIKLASQPIIKTKNKKIIEKANKLFGDADSNTTFDSENPDIRFAKGGEVYYNSHGELSKWSDIRELEVDERENYTTEEFDEWEEKYKINYDDEVIWVTPDINKALTYASNSEDYEKVMSMTITDIDKLIKEQGFFLSQFDTNKGFIIPESDDGENGFLFVVKDKNNILMEKSIAKYGEAKVKKALAILYRWKKADVFKFKVSELEPLTLFKPKVLPEKLYKGVIKKAIPKNIQSKEYKEKSKAILSNYQGKLVSWSKDVTEAAKFATGNYVLILKKPTNNEIFIDCSLIPNISNNDVIVIVKPDTYKKVIAWDVKMTEGKVDTMGLSKKPIYFDEGGEVKEFEGDYDDDFVFHGSPNRFEKFDLEKVGTSTGRMTGGYGIYFTNKLSIAKEYALKGGSLIYAKLKTHNFLDLDDQISDINEILEEIQKDEKFDEMDLEQLKSDYLGMGDKGYDIETNRKLQEWLGTKYSAKEVSDFIKRLGYDGTKFSVYDICINYVVFDSNNIELLEIENFAKGGDVEELDNLLELNRLKYMQQASAKFESGTIIPKKIVCNNCGWSWYSTDSDSNDIYLCHKCGYDNTFFNDNYMSKLKKPMTLEQISQKHSVPLEILKKELEKGIQHEKEHTEDEKIAETIALHHIAENPEYYTILEKVKLGSGGNVMEAGGVVVGKRHSEEDENGTGEKFLVKSTGQIVELEGGEGVLSKESMSSDKVFEFDGKKMTGREIASHLNHKYGGVEFANGGNVEKNNKVCGCKEYYHGGEVNSAVLNELEGGEAVVTVKTMESENKYDFDGKKYTPRQILSMINRASGGKKFNSGGLVSKEDVKFSKEIKMIKMQEFVQKVLY